VWARGCGYGHDRLVSQTVGFAPRTEEVATHPAFARLPSLEELRSPWAIERWRQAMSAGYAKAPRCAHVRRDGQQCKRRAMREARQLGLSFLCASHCRGRERDKIDNAREARLLRRVQSENVIRRVEAEASLASIVRRRAHRSWLIDARIRGSTVPHLNVRDSARLERWLAERNLNEGFPLQATGRPPTPRCWDRLIWTAILALGGRIDERGASLRLASALKDEVVFWTRLAARGGDVE
jgi:hypothetical protein